MQEANNIANSSACIDNNIMLVSLDSILAPDLQEICHNHTLQQQQRSCHRSISES